ncbi:MAG: PEP-CTERM sorting domain-containing protein [Armatimonadetes bacterium]|nr:PEP-CTERM sorting domain-containing protein [Armatimonadota bacterium]
MLRNTRFGRCGVLVAVTAAAGAANAQIIADSVAEYSSVQGQANWYYGYVAPATGPGFIEMTQFLSGRWYVEDGTYWTRLSDVSGHPNGPVSGGGRTPTEHWSVRRWISEVNGEINIAGTLAKENTGGGDGTMGLVLVDGVEVWSKALGPGDNIGVNYSVSAIVSTGDTIDFVIAPRATDWYDATTFTGTIGVVPEPATIAVLGFGIFALLKRRKA